ncbi:MAG: FkbM family methyltransferase [Betaproteobacteria bacterium]|nr:FkbM family methyltransferase [Betaproteobacteria bacterium]
MTNFPAPPWYFNLAKSMLLRDTPGAWRAMLALQRLKLLDRSCRAPFFDATNLLVPLNWPWFWKHRHLREYEPNTLRAFTEAINRVATGDAVLLDCGAHVGLVSHYVAQRSSAVKRILAFEPNQHLFPLLQQNCSELPIPAQAHRAALAERPGRARLVLDVEDSDGAFIIEEPTGGVDVATVDMLNLPENEGVVMKIDVEGCELPILKGAAQTLTRAPFFVILFEAHKEVMKRTGYDPMECVRFVRSLRKCHFYPSAQADVVLDVEQPFFAQIGPYVKRDVVIVSC